MLCQIGEKTPIKNECWTTKTTASTRSDEKPSNRNKDHLFDDFFSFSTSGKWNDDDVFFVLFVIFKYEKSYFFITNFNIAILEPCKTTIISEASWVIKKNREKTFEYTQYVWRKLWKIFSFSLSCLVPYDDETLIVVVVGGKLCNIMCIRCTVYCVVGWCGFSPLLKKKKQF